MFTARAMLALGRLTSAALVAHALGCMNDDGLRIPATSYPNDPAAPVSGWDEPGSADVPTNGIAAPLPSETAGLTPVVRVPEARPPSPPEGEPPRLPTSGECWRLPNVDRARLLPAPALAAALVGGRVTGSPSSPTDAAVELGAIGAAGEGQWIELPLRAASAQRYVTYYGPPGSYGAIAELELYSGDARVEGAGFGTAGSRADVGSVYQNALDGDTGSWFEGPLPSDEYVGLDLGAGHELPPPTFSPEPGASSVGARIRLGAAPGQSIRYTTDGSDPRAHGLAYTEPIVLETAPTLIKAVASGPCALNSPVAQAVYGRDGAPGAVQSSIHIGNSLTDAVVERLGAVAADGGVALELQRYTLPGAGTWLYADSPSGGFGVPNVQQALRSRPFDHVSMQPFPDGPCRAVASGDADSDSGYMALAWADALSQNPSVQLWVYQAWPAPSEFVDCITGEPSGGGEAPGTWQDAVANQLLYEELVRDSLAARSPDAPPPYIVPAGSALVALQQAIEGGEVPGMADFFGSIFQAGGDEIQLTPVGAYFVTLVFYGCMFQRSPEGLMGDSSGALSAEQAAAF
ncbi:MAG TPA: FN3 associated domain-containing protein, partial [Polyangiaceae bacterium]|nr:FN3 associated domain-containing protein [Polyangiaceae bacterium]